MINRDKTRKYNGKAEQWKSCPIPNRSIETERHLVELELFGYVVMHQCKCVLHKGHLNTM